MDKPDFAAVFDRTSTLKEDERETEAAVSYDHLSYAFTRGVLSPRITLSPLHRGIGNLYGASVEQLDAGGVPAVGLMRESVDGGRVNTDGPMVSLTDARDRVRVARAMMKVLPDLTYSPRSSKKVGLHKPIKVRTLVDAVCVHGIKLETIAKAHGWGLLGAPSPAQPKPLIVEVPKQQSQKIKAGLTDALDEIYDAWKEMEILLPSWILDLHVR